MESDGQVAGEAGAVQVNTLLFLRSLRLGCRFGRSDGGPSEADDRVGYPVR